MGQGFPREVLPIKNAAMAQARKDGPRRLAELGDGTRFPPREGAAIKNVAMAQAKTKDGPRRLATGSHGRRSRA
jgi:hypothetical protein